MYRSSINHLFSPHDTLARDLRALLTNSLLLIKIDLGGRASMALAVGLEVLDHLSHAEEVIHLLERQSLGLGYKEPDEEEHGKTEGSVDEECTAQVNDCKILDCELGTYP